MNPFAQVLGSLGAGRLAVMGAILAGVIAFFFYLIIQMTGAQMTLLFGDLENNDASQIVSKLESMGVAYSLRANGRTIMVPEEQVARLRISLAEQGLPSGGSFGYEIFDREGMLGTTSFVQNINHLRALEGEIARSIRTINKIEGARVHLVLPRRELFNRAKREASASIILQLRGRGLERTEVLAIQHLVAAAVPDLNPKRISIVDSRGNLLARGADGDSGENASHANLDDRITTFENRLRRQIEDLLAQSVGFGNVRAEVTAELDYDRITTNTESFDPDSQVVRSSQTVEEQAVSNQQDSSDVSVANNLPQGAAAGPGGENMTTNSRTEETVNYEITKTLTTEIREVGRVKRLSVAVLVNGVYSGPSDDRSYTPRSQAEMAQLAALVKSAIGFQEERDDTVEVANMRFPDLGADAEPDLPSFLGLRKSDYFRIAELAVMSIVALLVILLVLRPLVGRLLAAAPEAMSSVAGAVGQIAQASTHTAALAAPQADPLMAAALPGMQAATHSGTDGSLAQAQLAAQSTESEFDAMLDVAQIEGKVKASSMKKVGDLVQKHPDEAVGIIRGWLNQKD